MKKVISINAQLMLSFCNDVRKTFPQKAFGIFLSEKKGGNPVEYIIFSEDIRNEWKDLFENYGNYYKRNEDAGFLATPEETYRIEKYIRSKGLHKVGVFHSHQRHPAIFSKVDVDLHPEKGLWHIIISLRNLEMPQVKAFEICGEKVEEIAIEIFE